MTDARDCARANKFHRPTIPRTNGGLTPFNWLQLLTEAEVELCRGFALGQQATAMTDSDAVDAVIRYYPGGVQGLVANNMQEK